MAELAPYDVTDQYSPRVRTTPCQRCGKTGMRIERRPTATAAGLSGSQMKFGLTMQDVLTHDCGDVAVADGMAIDTDGKPRMAFSIVDDLIEQEKGDGAIQEVEER